MVEGIGMELKRKVWGAFNQNTRAYMTFSNNNKRAGSYYSLW